MRLTDDQVLEACLSCEYRLPEAVVLHVVDTFPGQLNASDVIDASDRVMNMLFRHDQLRGIARTFDLLAMLSVN